MQHRLPLLEQGGDRPRPELLRFEITSAFAKHPQAVFAAFDQQTATTVFADMRQLGDLHIPVIGEDVLGSPGYAKAMGQPQASKYLFTVSGASPGGVAYQHYLDEYQAVYHTKQILSSSYNMYDSVIISALAMTAAHSANPTVWVKDVTKVSDPPGTQCSTYASCVALLKQARTSTTPGRPARRTSTPTTTRSAASRCPASPARTSSSSTLT